MSSSSLVEVASGEALKEFVASGAHVLVCFSATWCGPCRRSKPDLMALADSVTSDPEMDLKVGIAYEHLIGPECIATYSVSAFPTYVLFLDRGQREGGRVRGADMSKVRELISQHGCRGISAFGGEGQTLGGGGSGVVTGGDTVDARALRLQRFGGGVNDAPPSPWPASKNEEAELKKQGDDDMNNGKEEAPKKNADDDVEMKDADASAEEMKGDASEKPVDPTAHLNQDDLEQLTTTMGFSLLRAQKGLLYGNGGSVEGAVEWLLEHQEDADIDDPIPATCALATATSEGGGGVAQSYRCNECGKILSNMANLELHANKTGHSDFEESTEAVVPLTAEQKMAKIEEIKSLLKARRAEREEAEKVDQTERERQRRFQGKEMAKTREAMEIEKRKHDAYLRKKEKEESRRERERLRMELAKDKAERMANKGRLSSKLGVEGYNPDGIQYDVAEDGGDVGDNKPKAKKQQRSTPDARNIDDYLSKVSSYRAGGDGGKCLKVLLAYVGNVVDKLDEKFKTINMNNKAYKSKVKPFVGAKNILLAVGFQPTEDGTALTLQDNPDLALLASTKAKIADALSKYNA